jgi:O-antigen/teichoic acid export membrane protein
VKHGYSLLFRDSAIYGIGTSLQKFLMILLMPLYTAFLTPADYGIVGMVNVTSQFIYVFINLGMDVAMSRFYFDDQDEERRRQVVGTTFLTWTVYPALLLGVLIAFMPQLSHALMGPGEYSLYFDIGMVNIFFTNWITLPYMLMRLQHRPYIFTVFTVSRVLIQVGTTVVLVVVLQWGIYGVLIGTLVSSLIMNLAAIPTYWRKISLRIDPALLKSMLGMAIPALMTGAIFFVLKLSDRWIIMRSPQWGKTEVGLYTAAFQLSQPVYLVMTAFNMAWPQWHYSRLSNPEEHKRLVARSGTYFITLCTFLLVAMGVFMPLLIRVLLHSQAYWSIGPTTMVLTLANVLYSLYYVLWVGCNVAKKNRRVPIITAVASGANIGLNLLLIPKYGMIAAAWTTVLGFAILAGLVYVLSRRYYPIKYEWSRFIKMAVAGATTLGATWLVSRAVGLTPYAPFGTVVLRELVVAPVLLLFPLSLWALRFLTPGERHALGQGVARITHRGRAAEPPLIGAASAEHPADELSCDDIEAEQEELEIEADTRLEVSQGDAPGV